VEDPVSQRGDRIFTLSEDDTVRVWEAVSGAELLRYDLEGYAEADPSPDETPIAVSSAPSGLLKVFPAWQTLEELMDHARACCIVRELTEAEREMLGLPARQRAGGEGNLRTKGRARVWSMGVAC
jgi:hypothetical protein